MSKKAFFTPQDSIMDSDEHSLCSVLITEAKKWKLNISLKILPPSHLHLSLGVHDHTSVVLEVQEGSILAAEGLTLTDDDRGGNWRGEGERKFRENSKRMRILPPSSPQGDFVRSRLSASNPLLQLPFCCEQRRTKSFAAAAAATLPLSFISLISPLSFRSKYETASPSRTSVCNTHPSCADRAFPSSRWP